MPHQDRERKKKNKPHRENKQHNEEEEESEPDEMQQITQINRILPDKNDHYEIKMKINGKYLHFEIDTGSPVTIMQITRNYTTKKDIQPLIERCKDVNKNEINFLGKVWAEIE